jgi:hypothetical protein
MLSRLIVSVSALSAGQPGSRLLRTPAALGFAAALLWLAVLLGVAGTGCAAPAEGLESAALTADLMASCPIPEIDHIAGNEAVFYQCADQYAEEGVGCSEQGYLLGYGTRYARRFYRETRPKMTAAGQQWIDNVLVCLQRELRDAIDSTTSCDEIWTTAFDQHPGCYLENEICLLPPLDIAKVLLTVDLSDWTSWDAARQAARVALGCGNEYANIVRGWFWYLL